MAKNAVQDGRVLDHTLAGNVTSGAGVVKGTLVGVAINSGVTGETIALHVTGVWRLPKLSTAVIGDGGRVIWDVSDNRVIVASATTGDIANFGVAVGAAGNGTTFVNVLLTPGTGTVTA